MCRFWFLALNLGILGCHSSADVQGSELFNSETHSAVKSSGCGKSPPYALGKTTKATGQYAGVEWTFLVYLPANYDKNTPMPIILQHPGWGMTAADEESGAGITYWADQKGFISVTPQGGNDNPNYGGPWYSWNAVGTTQSPGRGGATCTQKANYPSYCYTSCKPCKDKPQCDWTTCHETVTPTGTGTSDVGGFIPGLYNTLEEQLCIDTTREFAAGESNGGMMTYQLGVDLSNRLAAIAPQFGSFHKGFNLVPSVGVPVLDIHGRSDTTVPANVSLSGDGYYYTPVEEIFNGNEYSKGWKEANGCSGSYSHYRTAYDGIRELWCVSLGTCSGGDVVRCSYKGGHNWFNNGGKENGGLVTDFMLRWAKTSHVGGGYAKGEPQGPIETLQNVVILEGEQTLSKYDFEDLPQTLQPASKSHYGNPANGCRPDEDVIPLASGYACAPKISADAALADGEPPVPHCNIGGAAPMPDNGCPLAADVSESSKAWPVCLAKGNTTDPYTNAEFHCMLVCPCVGGGPNCGPRADAHCPTGATCERGELRNIAQGVCTYHAKQQVDSLVV